MLRFTCGEKKKLKKLSNIKKSQNIKISILRSQNINVGSGGAFGVLLTDLLKAVDCLTSIS